MSHTEGPLRVAKPNPYGGMIETEDGIAIAQTFAVTRSSPETIDQNAQRFVALWNGCEGINPEAVPGLLAALEAAELTFADMAIALDGMGIGSNLALLARNKARIAIAEAKS